ncbi:MAG: hypothetical protein AB1716_20610, partial [Planctomycetota bacterium]
LGGQLAGGLKIADYSARSLEVNLLAEQLLAFVQADPEMQRRMEEAAETQEFEGPFGGDWSQPGGQAIVLPRHPGYFWRVRTEPVEDEREDLKLIRLQVLHQPDPELVDDIGGAVVVRELGFLKAAPPKTDLVAEGLLDENMAEQLRTMLPIPGFDPHSADLEQLLNFVAQNPELMQMIAPYLQQILAYFENGGTLPAGLQGLLPQLGGASPDDLAELIRQQVDAQGGMLPPGPPPGGGSPPGGLPLPGVRPGTFQPAPGGGRGAPGGRVPPGPGGQRGDPAGGPPGGGRGGMPDVGRGSGPNGEYTIEDLMRLRDAYEQQQRGGGR